MKAGKNKQYTHNKVVQKTEPEDLYHKAERLYKSKVVLPDSGSRDLEQTAPRKGIAAYGQTARLRYIQR